MLEFISESHTVVYTKFLRMYFLNSSLTLLVCNLHFNLYSLLNSVADHLNDLYSTGNYLLSIFQKVQMSPSEAP